jgi:hypothetical protein
MLRKLRNKNEGRREVLPVLRRSALEDLPRVLVKKDFSPPQPVALKRSKLPAVVSATSLPPFLPAAHSGTFERRVAEWNRLNTPYR